MTQQKKHPLLRPPLVILAILFIIAGAVPRILSALRKPEREIPTTRVQRGNLDTKVYTTGELRAARSAMLVAPSVSGSLQIIHLANTGTLVKKGDAVVEFDPTEQEYNLEQNQSEFQQAEQEIAKLKADAAIQEAQDRVNLLKAKFDIRRAELEVSRNEVISAIDAKKNLLTLEESKRHFAQLEQDLRSRATSNQASLAVLEEKRNKARLKMQQAQQSIENMQLRSSMDGLMVVRENQDASGGFFFSGMTLPEYHEGDQVYPGRFIAEVLEVSQMEILAKVDENDRANLNPGQVVQVRMDAWPEQVFSGKIKTIAGLSTRRFWENSGIRKFDATFQLDQPDVRIQPGTTAQVIIVGEPVKNALYLPRQAMFEKEGQPVVFVKNGDRFEPHTLKMAYRTESYIVVEGLSEGTEVALVNPEAANKKSGKISASSTPTIGGSSR